MHKMAADALPPSTDRQSTATLPTKQDKWAIVFHQGPILLTWFNFNLRIDK